MSERIEAVEQGCPECGTALVQMRAALAEEKERSRGLEEAHRRIKYLVGGCAEIEQHVADLERRGMDDVAQQYRGILSEFQTNLEAVNHLMHAALSITPEPDDGDDWKNPQGSGWRGD
jgi:hypothetical protein